MRGEQRKCYYRCARRSTRVRVARESKRESKGAKREDSHPATRTQESLIRLSDCTPHALSPIHPFKSAADIHFQQPSPSLYQRHVPIGFELHKLLARVSCCFPETRVPVAVITFSLISVRHCFWEPAIVPLFYSLPLFLASYQTHT